MKLLKSLFCAICILSLTACGVSRHTAADVNLSSIREFAYIQPYSYIVCYGDDGKGYYDASDSRRATEIVSSIIETERFPFSDRIPADYDGANKDIKQWLENFPNVDASKIDRLRVPKSLRKLVENSGDRYGIVIYSFGYTQTKVGYQREKIEKAASRIIDKAIQELTGITGLTNPSQNYSTSSPYGNVLYCAVIDSETDRVVHFVEEVPTLASHPTESRDVTELLHKLLKEFIR